MSAGQDHPHAAFSVAAHLAPPPSSQTHSRSHSRRGISPTPSHGSHRSGVHAHVGDQHYHAQHGHLFIPVDGNMAIEPNSVLVSEANAAAEDAISDDEDAASERRFDVEGGGGDNDRERSRSVTWIDVKGSKRPGMVKTLTGTSIPAYKDEEGEERADEGENVSQGSSGSYARGAGEEEEEEEPLLGERDGHGQPEDWANSRGESIMRKPAWRRPSPNWLYPILIPLALSMGMTMAPKQELFINLACLAHPPQTQYQSLTTFDMAKAVWNAPVHGHDHTEALHQAPSVADTTLLQSIAENGNGTFTTQPHGSIQGLTPADKWMLDMQRRIAADKRRKEMASHNGTQPSLPAPIGSPPTRVPPTNPSSPDDPSVPDESDDDAPIYDDDGPRPGEIDPRICKKDAKVQAAAAKLQMMMSLCMGLLSALTTTFWGGMSDKWGRTRIMAIAFFGILINDIVLIATASYPYLVPGGYRFLIVGPVLDGCLGGFSTMTATYLAYISDSTPDGSRARLFARMGGVMMFGLSMGPIVGSWILTYTGDIITVFYIAGGSCAFFALYALIFMPESLSSDARKALKSAGQAKAQRRKAKELAEREWENEPVDGVEGGGGDSGWSRLSGMNPRSGSGKKMRGTLRRLRRRFFAFLNPLGIFLPKIKETIDSNGNSVLRKDWNLTFLAITAFFASMLMGMMQLKSQFIIFSFGWTSAELGPYMSAMMAARATFLLVILPLIFRYFKPKIKVDAGTVSHPNATGVLRSAQALLDARFDLLVMRTSLFFDTIIYILLALNVPKEIFIALSLAVTLGSGTGAAQNSLALNLIDSGKEAGRLFGALSVLQAIASGFLGPLIFSNLFAATVGIYAPTIFGLAALLLFLAQIWLSMVRLPKEIPKVDAERGRTRRIKRVKSSGQSQNGSGISLPGQSGVDSEDGRE